MARSELLGSRAKVNIPRDDGREHKCDRRRHWFRSAWSREEPAAVWNPVNGTRNHFALICEIRVVGKDGQGAKEG